MTPDQNTAATATVRIVYIEDDFLVASAMRLAISRHERLKVVAHLPTAEDVVEQVDRADARLLLIDRKLPGRDALEAVAELRRERPDVKAVVLSGAVNAKDISEALDAGVYGYISKTDEPEFIVSAIARIADGEVVFSPEALRHLSG